jgi:TonB family protein
MGLDEKAMQAIRTWKFEPGRKDGVAVAVQVSIEVSFRLY